MRAFKLLVTVGMILAASATRADVPQLITLQGLLRDGGGAPVADGDYSVAFTMYDAPAGGIVQWAETTLVATTGGLFTVMLGSVHAVPDSLFHDTSRYLGIKVEADPEMTPRQRLVSVGYSYVSSQWTSQGGNVFRASGRVGLGEPSPLTTLHVRRLDMSLPASPALTNEDILVEDDDAVLGLYSGTGGTFGSAIALGEVEAGAFTNKWSLYRTKTISGARLGFSYGTDTSYGANPTRMVLEGPTGHIGMGELDPLAGLHIQEMELSLPESVLVNENLVIEDDDAVLGLYSGTGGTFGSAVVLGEMDSGTFTNKWSLYRTKTTAGSLLGFSYGGQANYGLNPTIATLDGPNARMGIGTTAPQNKLDVEGAAAVGAGYSGASTAPANGLLVQGKVGLGTTSVFADANTNLTLPGSIGFQNGTSPMMYMFEDGTSNESRPVIGHSPAFQNYGVRYDDSADAFVYQGAGTPRVTIDISGPQDVLTAAGNITVGTGTTGCVKDADGTIIAGTCSSDERFKTEVKPFDDVLAELVQLEPVHFHWRTEEFPERNFGTGQSYGLIAQDVEKVMPELVTEDADGYRAVRYSKLPLLLLQAVKEQQQEIALLRAELASLRSEVRGDRAER